MVECDYLEDNNKRDTPGIMKASLKKDRADMAVDGHQEWSVVTFD